jgi:cyclopropane fatty-acyl-phospholipid synthase-like methyltransferase
MTSPSSSSPLARSSAGGIYDALGDTNYLTEQTHFTNLGFWRDAPTTLDDACRALTRLLGEVAELGPNDQVVDAGFGLGDQDLFWAETFGPRRIVGRNVSEVQVAVARARVAAQGLEAQIDLRYGSATAMPFHTGQFDKVLALESALHFDTRQDFFNEAYRVLRSGGRLALADVIPLEGWSPRVWLMNVLLGAVWQVPGANQYSRATYAQRMAAASFERVRVISIREYVYEPLYRFLTGRLADLALRARLTPAYLKTWEMAFECPKQHAGTIM